MEENYPAYMSERNSLQKIFVPNLLKTNGWTDVVQ